MSTASLNDAAVKARLRVVALVACVYSLSVGWPVVFGEVGWHFVGAALLLLLPVALSSTWATREHLDVFDWRMCYLPFLAWFVSFATVKPVVWKITHGAPFWLSYGADKGLANVIIEPGIVAIIGCLYFVGRRFGQRPMRRRRLAAVALLAAIVTPLLVPPLPE
jgi:hypothetical protein